MSPSTHFYPHAHFYKRYFVPSPSFFLLNEAGSKCIRIRQGLTEWRSQCRAASYPDPGPGGILALGVWKGCYQLQLIWTLSAHYVIGALATLSCSVLQQPHDIGPLESKNLDSKEAVMPESLLLIKATEGAAHLGWLRHHLHRLPCEQRPLEVSSAIALAFY